MSTLLSGLAASLKRTVTADVKVRKQCLQVLILLETVNDLNCVVLQLQSEFAAQDNQVSCRLGWLGGNQPRWHKSLLKPKTWADVLLKTRGHLPSSQNTHRSPQGAWHPRAHSLEDSSSTFSPQWKVPRCFPNAARRTSVRRKEREGRREAALLTKDGQDPLHLWSVRRESPSENPRPVRPSDTSTAEQTRNCSTTLIYWMNLNSFLEFNLQIHWKFSPRLPLWQGNKFSKSVCLF